MICEIHNQEMVVRPAGISKKNGQPYKAFYACEVKGPNGEFCQFKPVQRPKLDQAPLSLETPHSVPNNTSGRDFDRENVGKCQSLFLQAYIQSGKSIQEAMLQATQAKRLAEIVVYGHSKTEKEELQAEDYQIDTSDIPF